ncbi:MAG: type II secretion system protein [Verrucomicrobiota bacterium]
MKQKLKIGRGFTLVELLVVIVIIAALAGLTAPMVIRQRKKADQTEAVNNAKQIGLAMFEFENAYGTFPDASTAAQITPNNPTYALAGTTANDYFRQLIAAEISQSEAMFYAKTGFSKKPDNVYNSDTTALAAGEVGFGYLMNTSTAFSTAGNPSRPIVAAPLAFAGTTISADGTFDVDMYDSKAIVLRIDNSVQSLNITSTSKLAQLGGGKTLLQTGADTVWGTGVTPTMVVPIKK